MSETRQCPYCAEEIRAEAIKCRWCGGVIGETMLQRAWYRSRRDRKIAGVCAGLAEEFSVSVTILRLAFVLSMLLGGGVGLIVYVVLWVVMPQRPDDRRSTALTPPPA